MDTKSKQVERDIRTLLDAMDAQWGAPLFSANVDAARVALRKRFPKVHAVTDKSRERNAA